MHKNLISRVLELDLPRGRSLFLWGVRKTGKSTYLKKHYSDSTYIDLLQSGAFMQYSSRPSLIREQVKYFNLEAPIIIDEIQKVPELLDEIHWMIENIEGISFIMCGSSMRRIKHSGANLLGGRAWRQNFMPLCYPEIENFDLLKIFNYGLIPEHYLCQDDPVRTLRSYISEYLVPEIQWESRIRNFSAFSRFLDAIAFSNGEMISCMNIARESGIDAKTVQSYVNLLQEMMLGYLVLPYAKSESRKIISRMPKFYFFDTAVSNAIMNKNINSLKGADAGHSLEHYVFLELLSYRELNRKHYDINYWRTKTGLEVDFILDKGRIAIEVKISECIGKRDLKGIIAFTGEYSPERSIAVSLDSKKRTLAEGIEIYPLQDFLQELWNGRLV
jgi:predicted AAA+ superfamily ATPase